MSTARHAAEDGPDLSSEDETVEEKSSQDISSDQSQEDALPTLRLRESNGVKEDDEAEERDSPQTFGDGLQDLQPRNSEVLQAGKGVIRDLERPSSADGSLSIPDDTPSVQVGKYLRYTEYVH